MPQKHENGSARPRPVDDVGELEHWPFDNPISQYKIKMGAPRASGHIEYGGAGHTPRASIWRCTKAVFTCIEQGDEVMTILSGLCQLIDNNIGQINELKTGDGLLVRDGSWVTWEIIEDVTKVFFGHKASGF